MPERFGGGAIATQYANWQLKNDRDAALAALEAPGGSLLDAGRQATDAARGSTVDLHRTGEQVAMELTAIDIRLLGTVGGPEGQAVIEKIKEALNNDEAVGVVCFLPDDDTIRSVTKIKVSASPGLVVYVEADT